MEKFEERVAQPIKVTVVGGYVIGINVGDDHEDGMQQQERGIALVGFRHQIFTRSQSCIGAGTEEAPTDDERGIETSPGEEAGDETCGRHLAITLHRCNCLIYK